MIPFVKAHACGNDFVIVSDLSRQDLSRQDGGISPDVYTDSDGRREALDSLARRLCDRNHGVGADGVEFLRGRSERRGVIRLYNADGSIAEISGNGTRCVAAWIAYESDAAVGDRVILETDAGTRSCEVVDREGHRFRITSPMGIPDIKERTVALAQGEQMAGAFVSTGNPHFVIFVDEQDFRMQGRSWQSIGEEICGHRDFPHQTNVEFVRLVNAAEIEIRIYERGVGPTASSGTGTCATAAASIALRGAKPSLRVTAPGGTQAVEWQGSSVEMLLTGPAELICRGEAF